MTKMRCRTGASVAALLAPVMHNKSIEGSHPQLVQRVEDCQNQMASSANCLWQELIALPQPAWHHDQ